MTQSDSPSAMQITVAWPDDITSHAQPVNMIAIGGDSGGPDVVYLTLGHVGPPLWVDGETADQALGRLGGTIAVQPRGAFLLSRTRAEELHKLLGDHLARMNADGHA